MTSLLSKQLKTKICLPPGLLPQAKVKELLRLCLESYKWIKPVKYEALSGEEPVTEGTPFLDEVVKAYRRKESLMVNGRTEREGLCVLSSPVYDGYFSCWLPNDKLARRAEPREANVQQIVEMMRLVDSPLAYVGINDDVWRKTEWTVQGTVFFLNDYSEGLFGLFWRTFLGPPFVRLFGDRLATLPPGTARDLGNDIWLIEPYPIPADALTDEGHALEREFIEHLGKDCFLDHERQLKASRKPDLPFLDPKAAWREHERPKYEKKYGKGSPQVEIELKIDEIERAAYRLTVGEHPFVWSAMKDWAHVHRNDPGFLEVTPEQAFQEAKAQWERESASSPSPRIPELDRVRSTLGEQGSHALRELGGLAEVLETHAGGVLDGLDPELRGKVQGLAMLANLLSPKTSGRKEKEPGRKRGPKKKRSTRGSF